MINGLKKLFLDSHSLLILRLIKIVTRRLSSGGSIPYKIRRSCQIPNQLLMLSVIELPDTWGFIVLKGLALEWNEEEEEEAPALKMPCFPTVKEFAIAFRGVDLRMPETGTFASLTKMYIFGVQFTNDGHGISDAVTRSCPRHQDLDLHTIEGPKMLFLISQSLLSLRLIKILDQGTAGWWWRQVSSRRCK
ncbi:hypothetical protein EJB05_12138, partial [Eragrostis curvula]